MSTADQHLEPPTSTATRTSARDDRPTASPAGDVAATEGPGNRQLWLFLLGLLLLIGLVLTLTHVAPASIQGRFNTFSTIFLGILIEALPFLLAGSIVSGFIEVAVDKDTLARFVPRRAIPAAFAGALLGFAFPVCECGVVPVTRRLYGKGLPVSVGVAFLLAAPVVNPIVLLSTYAAFGFGPVLIGRFLFSLLIAFTVGLIFSFARPEEVLRPETLARVPTWKRLQPHQARPATPSVAARLRNILLISADDFLDMGRYLVVGSLLAAGMQTLIPQSTLLALGSGPVISVVVLMALAFILSVCSTVDAFLALSFVNTFTSGAILSFLVFGPMVDIKSSLMFLGVFRRKAVLYLILLPLLLSLLMGVFLNLNAGF